LVCCHLVNILTFLPLVYLVNTFENLDPNDSALTPPGDDQVARTQMDDVEMDGVNRHPGHAAKRVKMTEDPVSTVAMIKTLSTHIADSALQQKQGVQRTWESLRSATLTDTAVQQRLGEENFKKGTKQNTERIICELTR